MTRMIFIGGGPGHDEEHHLFERPLPYCPSCGSTKLAPVPHAGTVDLACRRCGRHWHVELGAFWRVDGLDPIEQNGAATDASV